MKIYRRLFGITSIAIFWLGVRISIHFNRWFNISRYTFSKLGKIGLATYPWIFSLFVSIGGIFMVLHGLFLLLESGNKLKICGSSYVLLSGVFMTLVGIFPDGTKPHDFIALSTFLLFYIGTMFQGLGSKDKFFKASTVIVFILAMWALIFHPFGSLGKLEVFGLTLVLTDLILTLFEKDFS